MLVVHIKSNIQDNIESPVTGQGGDEESYVIDMEGAPVIDFSDELVWTMEGGAA